MSDVSFVKSKISFEKATSKSDILFYVEIKKNFCIL